MGRDGAGRIPVRGRRVRAPAGERIHAVTGDALAGIRRDHGDPRPGTGRDRRRLPGRGYLVRRR
ncbi:hypothetical protein ACFPRL_19095 [Pseudoclavibacter helvolus]